MIYNLLVFLLLKFKKLKSLIANGKPPTPNRMRFLNWGNAEYKNLHIPKKIWTYWSGKRSACAEACLAALKDLNRDFEIITLDDSNISDYLPSLPPLPNDLPVQLVSDFIRLSLLENYGGIWIDRSVIVTESLSWVIDKAAENNVETICFYNESPKVYKKDHSRPIIENGFIAATKGSRFISSWLNNYRDCILSGHWETYYRNAENYAELSENFLEEDDNTMSYFSCYLAAQQTMLDSKNYQLLLINAEDDYYFYYYKTKPPTNRADFCEWILISKEEAVKPKLIKLHKKYRKMADEIIRIRCFNRTSILGKYLD